MARTAFPAADSVMSMPITVIARATPKRDMLDRHNNTSKAARPPSQDVPGTSSGLRPSVVAWQLLQWASYLTLVTTSLTILILSPCLMCRRLYKMSSEPPVPHLSGRWYTFCVDLRWWNLPGSPLTCPAVPTCRR